MSGLILPGIEAPRVSRKHRLAAKAKERREAPGAPIPNMQPRPRQIPPAVGCGVAPGPTGPALVVNLADGAQVPVFFTPDQARQFGIALISTAAQMEMLKRMADDAAADNQPVPLKPELEQLLAAAPDFSSAELEALKGDEGDVDDDPDLADGVEPAPNAFDINGKPCYEPPAE